MFLKRNSFGYKFRGIATHQDFMWNKLKPSLPCLKFIFKNPNWRVLFFALRNTFQKHRNWYIRVLPGKMFLKRT